MGSQPSQSNFIRQQWQLIEKTITHSVWRNRIRPDFHIEEHDKFVTDQFTYNTDKQIFQFRDNNPYLVAGVFLQQNEEHQFCSTNYKYRVFIEKIPIRLTDIEHIPFPDILHLYNQCLHGFHLLAQKVDYFFQVEQSYIGINQMGVVKVWLSKYFANHSVIGGKISQQQMVKGIIDIIDKNSDPYQIGQNIPTVRNYLYRNSDTLRFDQAKRQLDSYIKTYNNGLIPYKLDCVDHAGGAYFIANRPQIYHSQQSLVEQPYIHQHIQENSRFQLQRDQNRPQLVSNTNISQTEIASPGSYQQLQYMPLAPLAGIPNQLNLKGSQAFPQPHREKVIVNPVEVRQNMEVVRRRKSDYEKQFVQYPNNPPPNNMKYSQTLQQQLPLQSRHLNLSRHVTITPLIQSSQINTAPLISQMSTPNVFRIEGPNRIQSHARTIAQSSQQITFKHLNQNGQVPSLSISGNPSINNFSPGPSLLNSHRANFPSSPYIQDQTKTISQKSLLSPFSPKLLLPENSRKQISSSLHNNSSLISVEPKMQKVDSFALNNNSTVSKGFIEMSKTSSFEKSKEISPNPSLVQPQNELLVSFNPAFSKPTNTEIQNPFQKQCTPEVIKNQTLPETNHSQKRSIQINPNDGKSSEQFLRQLREINQSLGAGQRPKSSFIPENSPITNNGASYSKDISKGFYQQANIRSYYQIGTATPVQSILHGQEQQFGRNAVSNIIQNQETSHKSINAFINNEPLKFQNGLVMKQSRFEADQPQQLQFRKYQYGSYEAKMDLDLMADLHKLKQ